MNRFLNVVLKECPLDTPFASNQKCEAVAAAAAIAGVASLLGSLFSASSADDANATNARYNEENIKLQRENQQIQKDMFKQSQQFSLDMFNKQNDYNNPVREVARLLNAGINPAMMYGHSAPSASASVPNSPGLQAPQNSFSMQPVQYDLSGVGDAFFQGLSMRQSMALSDSQINYTNAKAEYEWQSMLSRLQQEANSAKKGTVEYEQAQENLRLFRETYENQKQAIQNNAALTSKNVEKADLDIAAKRIENSILQSDANWRDKMNAAQYNEIQSGIKKVLAEIENIGRDSALKIAQTAVENARKLGFDISNEQADMMVDIIVDKAEAELVQSERDVYAGKFAGKYLPAPSSHRDANVKKHRGMRKYRKSLRDRL